MKLIVISSPGIYENEHEIIQSLFENELEYFHLRKPGWPEDKLDNLIKRIKRIYHNRIIIHSHYQLSKKYKLKGIHFPEKVRNRLNSKLDFPPLLRGDQGGYSEIQNDSSRDIYQVSDINYKKLYISTSFHTLSHLYNYDSLYQYVFISPVFDSISKKGYRSAFKEIEIVKALNQTKYDVIALGGITIDRISKARQLGFSGIAVLGAFWNSPDPVDEFIRLRLAIRE